MISLPRASSPSALGKGRGRWKETEGRWSWERGRFPGVHLSGRKRVPMWTCQSSKCSERRARLGWAATHLSTLHPEQEQPFSTQATELRPAFSLLSFRCVQPRCVFTPEYFWGQEVVPAENSWIDSENEPGIMEGGPFSFRQKCFVCAKFDLHLPSPGCQMVDVFSLQIR